MYDTEADIVAATQVPDSPAVQSRHPSQTEAGTASKNNASHLEEFEIGSYRGIGGLSIKNATKMNLIVGKNGVGKTSLLEAVWLFYNRQIPATLWHPDLSRSGYEYADPTAELGHNGLISMEGVQGGVSRGYSVRFQAFHARIPSSRQRRQDSPNPGESQPLGMLRINLDGEEVAGQRQEFRTPRGLVMLPKLDPVKLPSALLTYESFLGRDFSSFSKIVKHGAKESLIKKLHLILPLLNDVEIIVEDDRDTYILGRMGTGERLRLEDLGGGMMRLFDCLVALYSSQNGIVCIDEIGAGLHHSSLLEFWKFIRVLCEDFNIQVFAATHSWECLNAAIKAYSGQLTGMRIYNLYRDNDDRIKSVSYSGEELNTIYDMNIEIR